MDSTYRWLINGRFYKDEEIIRPWMLCGSFGPIGIGILPAHPTANAVQVLQFTDKNVDLIIDEASFGAVGIAIGTNLVGVRAYKGTPVGGGGTIIMPQVDNVFLPVNPDALASLPTTWIHPFFNWSPINPWPIRIHAGDAIWFDVYNASVAAMFIFFQLKGHFEPLR